MKALNWNTTKEDHAYMKVRKFQNIASSLNNPNENWMASLLDLKWSRQAIWGKRLFDFWNPVLGIAIEVDGFEHNPKYDSYRDEYNFRRSGIVVLRVRNRNEMDAERAFAFVKCADGWMKRKSKLGIDGNTKASRRSLAVLPYPPSLLEQFIAENTP